MDKNGINETLFDFIYSEALDDATRRTDATKAKQFVEQSTRIKNAIKAYATRLQFRIMDCLYYSFSVFSFRV